MYVAKILKHRVLFHATLFEKYWSEQMLSNTVQVICQKRFVFRSSARRWINSEISKDLFNKKKLEIIDD